MVATAHSFNIMSAHFGTDQSLEVLAYPPSLPETRDVVSVSPKSSDIPVSKQNQTVDTFKDYREKYNRSPNPVQDKIPSDLSATSFVLPPLVVSVPLSYKRSSGNFSSGSSGNIDLEVTNLGDDGSERTVIVNFQVLVPKERIGENEEVRITGNVAALGKWDVFRSVPLNKKSVDLPISFII